MTVPGTARGGALPTIAQLPAEVIRLFPWPPAQVGGTFRFQYGALYRAVGPRPYRRSTVDTTGGISVYGIPNPMSLQWEDEEAPRLGPDYRIS
jgi:hypothetical protein